jgi:hypothetical protein
VPSTTDTSWRHSNVSRRPSKGLAFRDDLFPREGYRRTWEQLEARLAQREACKLMIGLLELAAHPGVEAILTERLDALLTAGKLPDLAQLRHEYAPVSPSVLKWWLKRHRRHSTTRCSMTRCQYEHRCYLRCAASGADAQ